MRPENSFVGQPIRSLQTMLRVIARQQSRQPSVIPDGFYTADTTRAVATFQRQNGLSATGVTDQATWDAIVKAYQLALIDVEEAQPLNIILNPNETIRKGQSHPNIYIVQGILATLHNAYGSIPMPALTGTLDVSTATAITAFQQLSLLPVTGELNKQTWKHMALHFPMAANMINRKSKNKNKF